MFYVLLPTCALATVFVEHCQQFCVIVYSAHTACDVCFAVTYSFYLLSLSAALFFRVGLLQCSLCIPLLVITPQLQSFCAHVTAFQFGQEVSLVSMSLAFAHSLYAPSLSERSCILPTAYAVQTCMLA